MEVCTVRFQVSQLSFQNKAVAGDAQGLKAGEGPQPTSELDDVASQGGLPTSQPDLLHSRFRENASLHPQHVSAVSER